MATSRQRTAVAAQGEVAVLWAHALLGVPREASADSTRMAILERLEASGFAPPIADRQAISFLIDPPDCRLAVEDAAALCAVMEGRLRAEVESLTAQFFELTPADRRQRWQQLAQLCEPLPRLRLRLAPLERALEIQIAGVAEDETMQALVERVCKLFLLPPGAREAQRHDWLDAMVAEGDAWKRPARRLSQRHPRIAKLDSDFVLALARPRLDLTPLLAAAYWKVRPNFPRRKARPVATPQPSSKGNWWWVIPLIFVVSSVGRLVEQSPRYDNSAPSVQWQPPPIRSRNISEDRPAPPEHIDPPVISRAAPLPIWLLDSMRDFDNHRNVAPQGGPLPNLLPPRVDTAPQRPAGKNVYKPSLDGDDDIPRPPRRPGEAP